MARLTGFSTLAMVLLLGCGGGAAGPSVSVAPEPRTVVVGDQLALSATPSVDLAGDLEWQVEEPFGGGLRNSVGNSTVYFAPEGAGTYHLILRAATADGHKFKQTVEVRVLPILTVEPPAAQTGLNGSVAFTLTLKGLPRSSVQWTVDEPDGGEVDPDGRYQAPAKAGTYHVSAVSALDPLASSRATVVVGP